MRIDLLHVAHCPNLAVAREHIRLALERAGAVASLRETEVATIDDAVAVGMHGSPTILIDGTDPFAAAGGEATISCRLFRTTHGIEGAPSVEQLVAVLEGRVGAGHG